MHKLVRTKTAIPDCTAIAFNQLQSNCDWKEHSLTAITKCNSNAASQNTIITQSRSQSNHSPPTTIDWMQSNRNSQLHIKHSRTTAITDPIEPQSRSTVGLRWPTAIDQTQFNCNRPRILYETQFNYMYRPVRWPTAIDQTQFNCI